MIALIDEKRQELMELCRKFAVKRLDVFGSAIDNTFDPARSDIDFIVQFETSTPHEHAKRYFGLLSALRNLFNHKVDLVEYRAIRNPYFKKSVDSSRRKLYGT